MELLLDINSDIYPLSKEKFTLLLTTSLEIEGKDLSERYEYVMHGRVYKFDKVSPTKMALYVSYGGLLMELKGDSRHLTNFKVGSNIYLLIKKL